jgi:MFS family permease
MTVNASAVQQRSTALQAWVLIMCSWLGVMASQVISPVLPTITTVFKDTPYVNALVSFVAAGQSLFVALLAPWFGALGDRTGHKRVLFFATLFWLAGSHRPPTLQLIAHRVPSSVLPNPPHNPQHSAYGLTSAQNARAPSALQTGSATLVAALVNVGLAARPAITAGVIRLPLWLCIV